MLLWSCEIAAFAPRVFAILKKTALSFTTYSSATLRHEIGTRAINKTIDNHSGKE
jgi:hypothetical protein